MNTSPPRWQAMIGGLRGLGGFGLLISVVLIVVFAVQLPNALGNSETPEKVSIAQLVNGEIGTGKYVSFRGTAIFEAGYEETEDGRTTATFTPIIDDNAQYVVIIKDQFPYTGGGPPEIITVIGMTRSTPSDLENLIEGDMPDINSLGMSVTEKIYVVDGQEPPNATVTLLGLMIGLIGGLVSLVPFFFPSVVFTPQSVVPGTAAALPQGQQITLKATGKFRELKQVEPVPEIGKKQQKFNNAIANAIPLGERNLLIYIHHVVKTKTYGITVNTRKSDWGIQISGDQPVEIESGKIIGWRDKFAVRFQTPGTQKKSEPLYLIFNDAGGQALFVELLQKMGFHVSSGMGFG